MQRAMRSLTDHDTKCLILNVCAFPPGLYRFYGSRGPGSQRGDASRTKCCEYSHNILAFASTQTLPGGKDWQARKGTSSFACIMDPILRRRNSSSYTNSSEIYDRHMGRLLECLWPFLSLAYIYLSFPQGLSCFHSMMAFRGCELLTEGHG